ncbi:unnamed protein product [Durusdinium trenchii]
MLQRLCPCLLGCVDGLVSLMQPRRKRLEWKRSLMLSLERTCPSIFEWKFFWWFDESTCQDDFDAEPYRNGNTKSYRKVFDLDHISQASNFRVKEILVISGRAEKIKRYPQQCIQCEDCTENKLQDAQEEGLKPLLNLEDLLYRHRHPRDASGGVHPNWLSAATSANYGPRMACLNR